jgi:hypothetical protein
LGPRRKLASALLFSALLVAIAPAFARDWYVAVGGPDGAAGTEAEPTSLFSALSRTVVDDTVIMRGGTYDLGRQVFLEREGLTLRNYPSESPTIVLPTNNASLSCVVWLYQSRCSLIGLEIVGGYYYGVKVEYPDCLIKDCVIRGTGRDAVKIVRTAPRLVIENCEVHHTGVRDPSNAEGIDNVAADDVVVQDCYIHHTATNGLYMKGGAARCIIERNLVTDTGAHGIMLGQSTDAGLMTSIYECRDSSARNNVVLRTTGSGLAFEAANKCRLYNNTCYDVARTFGAGVSVHANQHLTPSDDVYVHNNIIVVKSTRPMFFVHPLGLAAMGDMTCDRNIYYNTSATYKYWWEPAGNFWNSFEDWQNNTPYDATSLVTDPQFEGGLP